MSTTYHTPITVGAAANASTVNTPLGQLDQAIKNLAGGATVPNSVLAEWTEGEDYELVVITRNGDGVVTSSTVKWPDGTTGEFTATEINSTWLAIDAYTITHPTSGKTVTQAEVTRDADGNVIIKPTLTVA
jgi:hypothetical protein